MCGGPEVSDRNKIKHTRNGPRSPDSTELQYPHHDHVLRDVPAIAADFERAPDSGASPPRAPAGARLLDGSVDGPGTMAVIEGEVVRGHEDEDSRAPTGEPRPAPAPCDPLILTSIEGKLRL